MPLGGYRGAETETATTYKPQ